MGRQRKTTHSLKMVTHMVNGKRVVLPEGVDPKLAVPQGSEKYTRYDDDLATLCISLYSQLPTVAAVAKAVGIKRRTILGWQINHQGFRAKMKAARELRGQVFEEKAIRFALDATESTAQSSRLKVDTMKWAAEVNDRNTYGKSTKLIGDAEHPIAFMINTGIVRPGDEKPVEPPAIEHKEPDGSGN